MRGASTAVCQHQAGVSLLEMLVTLGLTSVVAVSLMTLLTSAQEAEVSIMERSDTERSGQLAITWVQRDLRRAGVGCADLSAPMPLTIPRADGNGDPQWWSRPENGRARQPAISRRSRRSSLRDRAGQLLR